MKKTADNFHSLEINRANIPYKCYTSHKISYLPSLRFNFQDMINNRLKENNPETSKSIFLLKGKIRKQDRGCYDSRRKIQFPSFSISVTLDQTKKQDLQHQSAKHISLVHQSASRKFNNTLSTYKKSQLLKNWEYLYQKNYTSLEKRPNKGTLKHERLKEKKRNYKKIDEMLIGNKTRLNFRPKQASNESKPKGKLGQNKNKIKFGTFHNPIHDICPWPLNEIFDEI